MEVDIDKLVSKYEKSRQKFQKKGEKIFRKSLKKLLANNPRVVRLEWVQYTPYFNDGDECIFSVQDIIPIVDFMVEDPTDALSDLKEHYEHEIYDTWSVYWNISKDNDLDCPEEVEKDYKEICKNFEVLEKLPDEIYKGLFGDHVRVIVTREKIQTEEYEHD